jgi:hypothetical protein
MDTVRIFFDGFTEAGKSPRLMDTVRIFFDGFPDIVFWSFCKTVNPVFPRPLKSCAQPETRTDRTFFPGPRLFPGTKGADLASCFCQLETLTKKPKTMEGGNQLYRHIVQLQQENCYLREQLELKEESLKCLNSLYYTVKELQRENKSLEEEAHLAFEYFGKVMTCRSCYKHMDHVSNKCTKTGPCTACDRAVAHYGSCSRLPATMHLMDGVVDSGERRTKTIAELGKLLGSTWHK